MGIASFKVCTTPRGGYLGTLFCREATDSEFVIEFEIRSRSLKSRLGSGFCFMSSPSDFPHRI